MNNIGIMILENERNCEWKFDFSGESNCTEIIDAIFTTIKILGDKIHDI